MKTVLKASMILVAFVTLLNLFVLMTGLHKNFAVGQTLFLAGAIALNVGVVYWALQSNASTNRYLAQLLTALGIGLLAGFIIVVVSWFLLGTTFPSSIDEIREAAVTHLEASGAPEAETQQRLDEINQATPFSHALPGGPGTLFTSLVSGAIIAIFQRKR